MATVPQPDAQPSPEQPELPVPGDHPERDEPIEPNADTAPELVNLSQDDEGGQSQSVAADAEYVDESPFGLEDSIKVTSGDPSDDVEDLVDHLHNMVRSGQIDMDAYRGERNDDDVEGAFGPAGEED